LRHVVEKLLLSDSCLDRGLFNPDAVIAAVHDHLANRRNHTYLLMALMVFELGQRESSRAPHERTELRVGRALACKA
jgi:hypothetical protein